MKYFAALILLLAPAFAFAADAKVISHYVLVPEQSKLKFVAIQNNAPVEGAFKNFSADIRFSPDDLDHSRITAEVDVASMFTAYAEVATQLAAPEWLDATQFPKATLRTTKIRQMPDRMNDDRHYYYAESELTIRGKTMPVEMDFVLARLDSVGAVAEGRISLQRRDFGVGQGKWQSTDAVEDVVSVTFRVAAKKVP